MCSSDEPTEVTVPVPWGFVAGKTWNDPKGIPVLLVHGLQDNAGSFDELATLLPDTYYLVAVDFPGHGKSSHMPPGVPIKQLDLIFTIDYTADFFSWKKFSIIGHSMGGEVGYYYAAVFPDRIDKIITFDSPIFAFSPEQTAQQIFTPYRQLKQVEQGAAAKKTQGVSYDFAIQILIAGHPEPLSEKSAKNLAKRCLIKTDKGYTFSMDLRLHEVREQTRFSAEQSIEMLKDLKCSLLLIAGSERTSFFQEVWRSFEPVKEFLQTKLSAKFNYKVVNGSHNVHMDYPERVKGLVTEFLQYSKVSC